MQIYQTHLIVIMLMILYITNTYQVNQVSISNYLIYKDFQAQRYNKCEMADRKMVW